MHVCVGGGGDQLFVFLIDYMVIYRPTAKRYQYYSHVDALQLRYI